MSPVRSLIGLPVTVNPWLPEGEILVVGKPDQDAPEEWRYMDQKARILWLVEHGAVLHVRSIDDLPERLRR